MSRLGRLIAVLASLMVPGSLLALWFLTPLSSQITVDDDVIPKQLGDYVVVAEDRLDADVLEMILPEAYVMRLYHGQAENDLVWAYVSLYQGKGPVGAHDPSVCYPAQGWQILKSQGVDVEIENGDSIAARLLWTYKHGTEELVLYWFQPAGRWPVAGWKEDFLRVYDSLRRMPQYGFVRLSTRTANGDRGREILVDLARELAPSVRGALRATR